MLLVPSGKATAILLRALTTLKIKYEQLTASRILQLAPRQGTTDAGDSFDLNPYDVDVTHLYLQQFVGASQFAWLVCYAHFKLYANCF